MWNLNDVFTSDLNTRLSFVCMVAEISKVKYTRRDDFCCTARLLCPSLDPKSDVEMNFFFHSEKDTPILRTPGDVGYFRDAVVSQYEDSRTLKIDLKNPHSKFALFDAFSDSPSPYQSSKETSIAGLDLDTARSFARIWIENHGRFYVSNQEDSFETIREEVGHPIDLACKVLSFDKEQDPPVLWIWDGTDIHPVHSRSEKCSNPKIYKNCDLTGSRFHHHPMEVEGAGEGLPELGSILPVIMMGEASMVDRPQDWVKLRNVKCIRIKGQLMIVYHKESRWVRVPEIPDIIKSYKIRQRNRSVPRFCIPKNSVSHPIEDNGLEYSPLRTVSRFLYQALQQRVNTEQKFRCLVFVTQCYPPLDQMAKATHKHDASSTKDWRFGMKLMLEDPTSKVLATIYGENGNRLFGVRAQDLSLDVKLQRKLKILMEDLIKKNNPIKWLDVCLKVVYHNEKSMIEVLNTVLNEVLT